eukprot:CAMPEP_0201667318 /NCGR_PEP_ID=MMETSP0494-20130426/13760_1 /ASSEMBLY_ACC=CAM_ASM_000839 /TAXON_ID=420259 /ORGANISM="Thalassiosira gravida, Strain GMp14c1" /LENGTH=132 /DNA_ID=CAMNT_0048147211 /DNA_START=46 /DNA_END=441 /DNA_ORIENTATION=+
MIIFTFSAASSTASSGKTAALSKSTFSILQSPMQALGSSTSESLGVPTINATSIVTDSMCGRITLIIFLICLFDMPTSISHSNTAALVVSFVRGSAIFGTWCHVAGCRGPSMFTSMGRGLMSRMARGPSTTW